MGWERRGEEPSSPSPYNHHGGSLGVWEGWDSPYRGTPRCHGAALRGWARAGGWPQEGAPNLEAAPCQRGPVCAAVCLRCPVWGGRLSVSPSARVPDKGASVPHPPPCPAPGAQGAGVGAGSKRGLWRQAQNVRAAIAGLILAAPAVLRGGPALRLGSSPWAGCPAIRGWPCTLLPAHERSPRLCAHALVGVGAALCRR